MVEDAENERVGKNIAALRGDKTQQAVADGMRKRGHAKWSQSTVWAVEKGTRPLRLTEALDLSTVLGCLLSDLLKQPEEVHAKREIRSTVQRIRENYDRAVDALVELIGWQAVLSEEMERMADEGFDPADVLPLVVAAQTDIPEKALHAAMRAYQEQLDNDGMTDEMVEDRVVHDEIDRRRGK